MLEIDADFPGGNIVLDKIDGDVVYLAPDLRNTEGTWFYWYFRLRGAEGRRIQFHFNQFPVIGARGPAVSWDQGASWQWLGLDKPAAETHGFAVEIPIGATEVRFSNTFPYTQKNWDEFTQATSWFNEENVFIRELCLSRNGRRVEWLEIRPLQEVRNLVVVTCRHHACESMASYALEGLIHEVLQLSELRRHTEFVLIPFMDKDGVEQGDQGKNRTPVDYNRDYNEQGYHPETLALRELLMLRTCGRRTVALDLHCPGIWGEWNEKVYFVGDEDPVMWNEQVALFSHIENHAKGAIPVRVSNGLPFGQSWNTQENYRQGATFRKFVSGLPDIVCASTLEIPYANASGVEVNKDTARALGSDIARGLASYLT